ncbi:MAG: L-2-hydroxyglutarate oxidase [Ignavibacteria bacterium]
MRNYDIIVVGAGIIGLASAYQIIQRDSTLSLCVIEKEKTICQHQTGNNSGVIHSGIYYRPNSLKALNCRYGYNLLLDFCKDNNVPYKICGKVIIATKETELPQLSSLYEKGINNGLEGLKILSSKEISEIEPFVKGVKGIYVPQTGVIDFKVMCQKLLETLKTKKVEFKFSETLRKINIAQTINVQTDKGNYQCKKLVTCCGLFSDRVARMTDPDIGFRIIPFRGEYYKLLPEKTDFVKSLIYPVPDPAFPFLGVHFTRKISNEVEAGPNAVFAFKREGYKKTDINLYDLIESLFYPGFMKLAIKYWRVGLGEYYRSFSKRVFVNALKRLIPEISTGDLIKGGSGVRAQACDQKGNLIDDFLIVRHNNVVHICNAPSPAATASLAIGETIAKMVFDVTS